MTARRATYSPPAAGLARREIVLPPTVAVPAPTLGAAPSRDARHRHPPGGLHRHGWSAAERITRTGLGA
ncbi:MAG TPA: hypothetical protein VNR64_18250, partial [Vicinamibacterales bacterium]|nr:hypothetical protein [Vicinamibacterales bacterium]